MGSKWWQQRDLDNEDANEMSENRNISDFIRAKPSEKINDQSQSYISELDISGIDLGFHDFHQ